jgi:hypothetical protein
LPNFIIHSRTWSANITTRLQQTYWPKLPWSGATEPFRDTERVTPRNGGLSPARLGHVCDLFMHAFVDRTLLPSPLKASWHFALFTSIKPHRSCKNSSLAVWSWSRISLIRFSSRLALWESLTYFDRFGHTRTIGIVGPGFPHANTFSDPTRLRIFCDLKSFAWNEDEWRVRDLHSQIFQEKTRPGLPNARQSAALEPVPPSELQNPTVNAAEYRIMRMSSCHPSTINLERLGHGLFTKCSPTKVQTFSFHPTLRQSPAISICKLVYMFTSSSTLRCLFPYPCTVVPCIHFVSPYIYMWYRLIIFNDMLSHVC